MKHVIYLAGQESDWKKRFAVLLDESGLNEIHDIEIAHRSAASMRRQCFQSMKQSTVAVAWIEEGMEWDDVIETMQELSWARDIFQIPVVLIQGADSSKLFETDWLIGSAVTTSSELEAFNYISMVIF